MKDSIVRENSEINKAIIDEEVVVEEGSKIGEGNEVTVIGYHSVVLEDAVVEDGAMIYPESILH